MRHRLAASRTRLAPPPRTVYGDRLNRGWPAHPSSPVGAASPTRGSAPGPALVLDAGDTIQGTPLAYYYAKVQPIGGDVIHPMARAMNLVGYDAAALGNHEFNYGIPLLRTFHPAEDWPLATGVLAAFAYVARQVGDRASAKVEALGLAGITAIPESPAPRLPATTSSFR